MKIFVVHASVGAGHQSAAKAIYVYFKGQRPSDDIRIIDILQYSTPVIRNYYIKGYSFLVKYAPPVWKLGFLLTANKLLRPFIGPPGRLFNRLNTLAFSRLLKQEQPDIIISTHFLASEIVSNLKKSRKIRSTLSTVVTDFIVHPFWISPCTDYYIVASGLTRQLLAGEGINENIIKDLGIPVQPKFSLKYDKAGLTAKIGIEKDKFTVLVVTGSFGVGPIKKIAHLLHNDAQLLIVCASNKKLFKKLKGKNLDNVHVYGFVDNMQELMCVSDMIITKPGGLTISEALNMELIPVFIYPIPGQETGNVSVLKQYGVGFSPKTFEELRNIVLDFKQHPDRLAAAEEKIRNIKKPDCLEALFNLLCNNQ